jgi:hypothetical protein
MELGGLHEVHNGEDCVLLNSTKQTGQLVQKPVTVTGREEQQRGLLLDTSVGFKGGKFAAGLDVNAKRTYKVKIGGDVEEVDGSNIEYCIGDLVAGTTYQVTLHHHGSKSKTIEVGGEDLSWSELSNNPLLYLKKCQRYLKSC